MVSELNPGDVESDRMMSQSIPVSKIPPQIYLWEFIFLL